MCTIYLGMLLKKLQSLKIKGDRTMNLAYKVMMNQQRSGSVAKLVQLVVQDSTQYVIAENWENQTALDLHNKKERLKSFVRNISQYLIEDYKISMSY